MMFITSKKSINQNLIALTGVTKAGFLLKRQNLSSHRSKWKSCFVILNDHCLSYCCEKSRFERPEGNILITAGTKVYPQAGEEGVIRVETGCEVMFLRGRDDHEMKEWTKSIRANVSKLKTLARGQFRVKTKGRVREFFFMLHRECITAHPSFSQTIIISKIFPITESSSFEVNGNRVDFKSDTNGETLSIVAKNDIEHRHWCYSLRLAIESQRNCAEKSAIPPPAMPVHSGSLLSLDSANMKWARKYLVLTEDCLYIHGHRRVGFHAPQKFILTPNVMIFSTTLKEYSFELVFFSDSIHLCAASEEEKGEWIHALEQLIPRSSYDKDDELQAACFDRDVDFSTVLIQSERSPGILLERRGNWAIVSSVSEDLSRLVFPGSILASVNEESAMVLGFERVAHELRNWRPPLRLNFFISPRKMGWLGMVLNERSKSWWDTASGSVTTSVTWEKVYATLSQGVLTLFTDLKKDGKSKKRVIPLYGSAVSLAHVESVNVNRNCFRILNGMQSITLKANSYDDMIDWTTAIAHGISMENGGGFLLEKEQNDRKRNRRGFPIQKKGTGLAFQGADDGEGGGEHGRNLSGGGAYTTFLGGISPISLKESSNECRDLRDFKPSHLPPIMEQDNKSKELNVSHFTDFTEAETTFKSLDPADLSETMENFARDFFVFKTSKYPVQALTKEYNDDPWVDIDRGSSATGSSALSEVLEIDGNSHVSKDNFNKLLQYTTNSLKISDFDVGVGAF